MVARIPKWLFVIVPVNVLAIAGALVAVNVVEPAVSASCSNAVSLYFDDDAAMRAALDELRADRRVSDVQPETVEQARGRLVRWPAARGLLYQADTAAAIHFAAKDPAARPALIDSLKKSLNGVHGARPVDCTTRGKQTEAQLDAFPDTLKCSRRLFVWGEGDDDLEAAAEILRNDPRVDEVRLVSREEAYERVRELAKDDPAYAQIGPDDVPARLDVAARDAAAATSLVAEAKAKLPHIESADTLPCFAVPSPLVPAPKK